MKETLQFQCYNCPGTFYNRVDLTEKPTLWLECPYCGASCSVNLTTAADSNDIIVILRDGQQLTLNLTQLTNIVIPTNPPE
jgi:hypothetical protein